MNPDQTALRAVYSGSILFAIQDIKVHKQMKEQMTVVRNCGENVDWLPVVCSLI